MQTDAPEQVVLPSERQDIDTAATTEGYSLVEAKALHEVGVRNHGWYMTEAEHRGVLDVLERLESALRRIEHWPFDVGHTPERDLREIKEAAHDAVE